MRTFGSGWGGAPAWCDGVAVGREPVLRHAQRTGTQACVCAARLSLLFYGRRLRGRLERMSLLWTGRTTMAFVQTLLDSLRLPDLP